MKKVEIFLPSSWPFSAMINLSISKAPFGLKSLKKIIFDISISSMDPYHFNPCTVVSSLMARNIRTIRGFLALDGFLILIFMEKSWWLSLVYVILDINPILIEVFSIKVIKLFSGRLLLTVETSKTEFLSFSLKSFWV